MIELIGVGVWRAHLYQQRASFGITTLRVVFGLDIYITSLVFMVYGIHVY